MSHKRKASIASMLFLLVLTIIPSDTLYASSERKQILILHSYHHGYKWTDDILRGIEDVFQIGKGDIDLRVEYLDTKHISDEAYLAQVYQVLQLKYQNTKIDLIISSDDSALNFLLKYADDLFAGVPVVFCGANFFDEQRLANHEQFTGVSEEADIQGTLDIALKFHPNTRQVVIVNDTTVTGRILHERIVRLTSEYPRVMFTLLEDITMDDIRRQMSQLPPDSLVIITIFTSDKAGNFFEYNTYTSLISQSSRAPVYGTWDFSLGYGIVGGKLTSGYTEGQRAAQIAQRILRGESSISIPVVKQMESRYMFDYNQLQRFHIRISDLPQGSVVINRPDTLYERYKEYIWLASFSMLFLLVIIIVLMLNIRRRKRVEESLRESEKRLSQIIDFLPDATFTIDLDGVITTWNRTAEEFTGVKAENMLGKGNYESAIPFYGVRRPLLIDLALHPSEEGEKQYPYIKKEGGMVIGESYTRNIKRGEGYMLGIAAPLYDSEGKVIGAIESIRDITERKQAEEALRHRLAGLEALHTVSAALRTAQTRDEALSILLDETLAALETDAGMVWLYHPEHDELSVAVDRGWFQQLSETMTRPGEGIAGRVFATGQVHISTEFANDPFVYATTRVQIPPGWGGACVPIRTGTLTVGVFFVSVPFPRQLTAEQVSLLESLAEIGGSALHRMSLHDETMRQLNQLQTLRLIDRAITASMDLHMTLDILLEQVTAQLKVDTSDVLLLNPHTLMLEYAAGRGFRTSSVESTHIRLGENFAGRVALERRAVHLDTPAQTQENPQFAALWADEGFSAYYAVPLIAKGQVKGVLEVFHRASLAVKRDWVSFLEMLAGQAAIAIENAQLFDHLQRSNVDLALAYDATIEGWSKALDLRDKETEGHTLRVTEMTLQLARAAGLTDEELVHVRRGALLHDIGKMGIPDAILLKPGELTEEEWAIMHRHPIYAYEMLSSIAYLYPALDIPYCHHEKWDGTGYPRGLKGEQIPLTARLFAVIDVYDALISDRLYRAAWSREKTIEYIESLAGTYFDPQVVKLFMKKSEM